jgi:exodeoxyribonuclease-5
MTFDPTKPLPASGEKLPSPGIFPLPFPLNEDQDRAVTAMVEFLDRKCPEEFFVLRGPAGTGKTYCIKDLVNRLKGRLVFTAPTNKATKVLRESVTTDGYKPDCRTIYSLLGLRLEPNGEIKEIAAPEDPIDLSKFFAVVVDEGSMVNALLMKYITLAAREQQVKFIFMGDPAQLPPVKELRSPIWGLDCPQASLTKVMRHDNQILKLATTLRGKVDHPAPSIQIASDNDAGEGIWRLGKQDFATALVNAAAAGQFSSGHAKAIAWRNITVDQLNRCIRNAIFDDPQQDWLVGDRLIMLEPARDRDGEPMASTDDEGTVQRVSIAYHPLYGEYKCWALSVAFDDNRTDTVWLLHEDSRAAYESEVESLAAAARDNRRLWPRFWEFKEAFHKARYAYAITAHRSQGSTYADAYVDYQDILLNRNRQEAFRCLYVAVTRPRKRLFLA